MKIDRGSFPDSTKHKATSISRSLVCAAILVASFVLPSIVVINPQITYAQTPAALKTFDVKMKLDRKVIDLGDDVKVKIKVRDQPSGDPLSGVIVKVSTLFAGAKTIQQVGKVTDADGEVTVTIKTSERDLSGVNIVEATVIMTGYQDAILANSFATTQASVPDIEKCDDDDDDDDCFD